MRPLIYATIATSTMMTNVAAIISPFDNLLVVAAGTAADEAGCDVAAGDRPLGMCAAAIPVDEAGAYTGVAVDEDCATATRVEDESRRRRCRSAARSIAV